MLASGSIANVQEPSSPTYKWAEFSECDLQDYCSKNTNSTRSSW